MGSYQPSTIHAVAQAMPAGQPVTAGQIQATLAVDYAASTIRAVLRGLVRDGLAAVDGDVFQKRYRRIA